MTSLTSAARAGAAVLTSFTASDNTLGGKLLGTAYGGCDDYSKIFTSIPAAEHMTITIHGTGNEKNAYLNMLSVYPTGCVSIVSDSYDYKKAVSTLWCGELVEAVQYRHANAKKHAPDQPHFVVIRPDSGDMIDNVLYTLDQLASAYGFTTNDSGFQLLSDEVRVIQGDGINLESYCKGGLVGDVGGPPFAGSRRQKLNHFTAMSIFSHHCNSITRMIPSKISSDLDVGGRPKLKSEGVCKVSFYVKRYDHFCV